MKKIHIIEAIQSFFASDLAGDQKGTYHPEEIKVHLSNVFNQVVYNTWLNGKKFSDFSQLDAWSKTYEIIVTNQVGTIAYAFLPFAPIQLPNGAGLRQVCDHADTGNVLAPIEATANVVFAELEVDAHDDTPTYRLEQNNLNTGAGEKSHLLRLERLPIGTDIISTLDVMMIQSLEQADDFDEIACPAGSEDSLIKQVIDIMSKKPVSDTTNDMVFDKKV